MNYPDHSQNRFSSLSLYHQIAFLEVCWRLEAAIPKATVQSGVDLQVQPVQSQTSLILDETGSGQRQQAFWVPFVWLFL